MIASEPAHTRRLLEGSRLDIMEECGKSSSLPAMPPESASSPYKPESAACQSVERPPSEDDLKQLEEPLPHQLVDVIDVPEDNTPDDTEGSLLSDPRFSAFLIQSPSMKYDAPSIHSVVTLRFCCT